MIPQAAQDTINKWIADGDTPEQAVKRFEGIMRCKLPEIIRPFIHDIRYDDIRELNLDEERLNNKEDN